MGDTFDENAPGNEWRARLRRLASKSESTSYYLHAGGKLSTDKPADERAQRCRMPPTRSLTIRRTRCPRSAATTLLPIGPMDQPRSERTARRAQVRDRPLEQPVEVVGRIATELFVSTDAEDTDFVVKLIDVYPNGYEACCSTQPLRLRFREGFNRMVKAKPGEVYPIKIDLWSAAIAFNKGHRSPSTSAAATLASLRAPLEHLGAGLFDGRRDSGQEHRASHGPPSPRG